MSEKPMPKEDRARRRKAERGGDREGCSLNYAISAKALRQPQTMSFQQRGMGKTRRSSLNTARATACADQEAEGIACKGAKGSAFLGSIPPACAA